MTDMPELIPRKMLFGNPERTEVQLSHDGERIAYLAPVDAFEDAPHQFDVRFYLVAILFIIFDLEVALLFPWALVLGDIGLYGWISAMIFLTVLTVGFIYEWKKGALDWE